MPRNVGSMMQGGGGNQGGSNGGQGGSNGTSGATYNYYGDGHNHYHGSGTQEDFSETEPPYLQPGFVRSPSQDYIPGDGKDPFFDGYQRGLAAAKKKYGR